MLVIHEFACVKLRFLLCNGQDLTFKSSGCVAVCVCVFGFLGGGEFALKSSVIKGSSGAPLELCEGSRKRSPARTDRVSADLFS